MVLLLHPYSPWDSVSINDLAQLRSFSVPLSTVTRISFSLNHPPGAYNLLPTLQVNSVTWQQVSLTTVLVSTHF